MPDVDTKKLSLDPKVSCDVCLKEIPRSAAQSAEARDRVLYFCGLECYEKWRKSPDRP